MKMREYHLLIVDSDATYADRMTDCLSTTPGLKIVGTANDGARALNLLHSIQPDIVLLDPLLPELDGLSLMKAIQKMKISPTIVCISQFYTSISIELARRNGASYYVYKPIDPSALATVLIDCATAASEMSNRDQMEETISRNSELSRRIHALMHELGFSSKFSGSEYIAESVELASESPMILHNLTTGLYRQLAERNHISPACIERSMRTAIAAANADGRLAAKIGATPTNKTCIRFILSMLNLQS